MNIGILIISHGEMANGTKQAIEFLIGKQTNITSISAYVDDQDLEIQVSNYFESSSYDKYLLLADLFGGSVNTLLSKYVDENVYLVAGFNLALVIDLVLKQDINNEIIRQSIEESKEAIVFMNEKLRSEGNDDSSEDFF